ncbi:hypothetical protein [Thermus brockianus]
MSHIHQSQSIWNGKPMVSTTPVNGAHEEVTSNLAVNRALGEAISLLEAYRARNLITRYNGPEKEGPIYVFTAYVPSPEAVDERYNDLAVEFVRLSRKHKVTVLLDVEEDA